MNPVKQGQFRILSSEAPLELLDESLIARCANFVQALGVSKALARIKRSDKDMSELLGLQQSVWSRIQNKPKDAPAYTPEDRVPDICDLFGNVGIIQWFAYRAGYRLVPIVENEKQKLLRKLAELEALEEAA